MDPAGTYEERFELTVPAGLPNWDLSTVRVERRDGATPDDERFRAELFSRVGAVTVAGGEVETGMKRLLLLLRGDSGSFSLVDETWTSLHRALLTECDGADDRRRALSDVLAWGEENSVKSRRDDVVHASWWLFAGYGARRSRFYRKTDGVMILGSIERLDEDAEILFEYAHRLDDLLGSDWPMATLPAPEPERASERPVT